MRELFVSGLFVCAVVWASGAAHAAAVTGGDTTFTLTVDSSALGVDVSPVGDTTPLGGGAFVVPITGGAVTQDLATGSIEHQGSGFDFDFGGVTLRMTNLRFDLSEMQVDADLSAGPFALSFQVFNLKNCVAAAGAEVPCTGASGASNEFGLFLRPQAADLLENDVFGDRVFDDDDQIFLAAVRPAVAPEPAGALVACATAVSLALLIVRAATLPRRPRVTCGPPRSSSRSPS